MVGAFVGSTQREPLVVGKPSTFMMDYLANKYGLQYFNFSFILQSLWIQSLWIEQIQDEKCMICRQLKHCLSILYINLSNNRIPCPPTTMYLNSYYSWLSKYCLVSKFVIQDLPQTTPSFHQMSFEYQSYMYGVPSRACYFCCVAIRLVLHKYRKFHSNKWLLFFISSREKNKTSNFHINTLLWTSFPHLCMLFSCIWSKTDSGFSSHRYAWLGTDWILIFCLDKMVVAKLFSFSLVTN
jgi:hypothetical protein